MRDASATELVETVRLAAVELAARAAPDQGVVAVELAEGVGQVIDLMEAALTPLVRRVDASGACGEWGFASTSAWLRSRLGMSHARALERVRLARQLPRLTKTAERLTGGGLSCGKANVIAGAVSRLDDADVELAEDALLGLADAGHNVNQLTKDAARIVDLIGQQRGKEKEPGESRRGFRRSWLTVSRSLDGGAWVRGWFTPEHAATFEEIVGPLTKPADAADERDHAQRTADALFTVMSEGNKGAGVTVIIDLAAYTNTTGDTGLLQSASGGNDGSGLLQPASDGTGDGGGGGLRLSGLPVQARSPARLLNGTEIPPERARQIALNAGINALILGPSGSPLYLGRTVRLATAAQRKALLALYDTCCVKDCEIPAHLTEIHHLAGGWKIGTPTNIDRLAPTCSFHNKWIENHPGRIEENKTSQGRTIITLHPPRRTHDPVPAKAAA